MKQIPTTCEAQSVRVVACPTPAAVSDIRLWAPMGGARPAAAPAYALSATDSFLGKHARKQTGMARIDANGWPPGPQDRSSG